MQLLLTIIEMHRAVQHVLPEYGLSWVGGDSRLALEATRDAMYGNAQRAQWQRTCYGAFERW